ncbi:MAG: helix-turn-helix transcriptional regulator [Clostridia bacterium]|nr:helix-turn-helix transcriptional regulator [Clostridia bacterium]
MKEIIKKYISYLEEYHNLSVSIHFSDKYDYILLTSGKNSLSEFNYHTNPYCFYIKNIKGLQNECMNCQRKVLNRLNKTNSFIGICHAGVLEYITGINYKDEFVGFISISGYGATNYKYEGAYSDNLNFSDIPSKILDKLIPPLAVMISVHIENLLKESSNSDFYTKLISYLENNHSNVSLEELSDKFNYSKSFISHVFKKRNGQTLLEYCNTLKIRDAKILLKQTNLSITDVAFMSGFNNFSYFINVFRKHTGVTPLCWRRNYKNSVDNLEN